LTLLLLRAKAAVQQLLLALHQLAHAAHHCCASFDPCCGIDRAGHGRFSSMSAAVTTARAPDRERRAREIARPVEHALQIAAADTFDGSIGC